MTRDFVLLAVLLEGRVADGRARLCFGMTGPLVCASFPPGGHGWGETLYPPQ